jgi:2-methylcitrate dehydratase
MPSSSAQSLQADQPLVDIADYVCHYQITSARALDNARICLMAGLAAALNAPRDPEAAKLLGPVVPGTLVPHAARVPGTRFELDPVKAAWDIALLVDWAGDEQICAGGGSLACLGPILSLGDYQSRNAVAVAKAPKIIEDLLHRQVKAMEIQGVLAQDNPISEQGLDPVCLLKLATAAVSATMLGLDHRQVVDALSLAWADGASLQVDRHSTSNSTRQGWAAADAVSRGLQLAMLVERGEQGIPQVLSCPKWGFQDALLGGAPIKRQQAYASQVMDELLSSGEQRQRLVAEIENQFWKALKLRFAERRACGIYNLCLNIGDLETTSVDQFIEMLVI